MVGVSLLLCAVAVSTATAYAHPPRAVLATTDSVAGVCHLDQDPDELTATASDTAPAVSCGVPHQSETAFQLPIGGPLALQSSRPNPELLDSAYSRGCGNYYRIRRFLGARAPDVYWGLSVVAHFPSPSEWAHGIRVMVCDLYSDTPTASGPVLRQDLEGILRSVDSSEFRLCRLGESPVTCDHLHDTEATSPNVMLPSRAWPGTAGAAAEAKQVCLPVVDAYLGSPLSSRPGLVIEPTPITAEEWANGERSVDCWIGTISGPATGTVRGGLR